MWRREHCFLAMFLSYCREHRTMWASSHQYRDILFDILNCHEKNFQKGDNDDDTSSVELICETRTIKPATQKQPSPSVSSNTAYAGTISQREERSQPSKPQIEVRNTTTARAQSTNRSQPFEYQNEARNTPTARTQSTERSQPVENQREVRNTSTVRTQSTERSQPVENQREVRNTPPSRTKSTERSQIQKSSVESQRKQRYIGPSPDATEKFSRHIDDILNDVVNGDAPLFTEVEDNQTATNISSMTSDGFVYDTMYAEEVNQSVWTESQSSLRINPLPKSVTSVVSLSTEKITSTAKTEEEDTGGSEDSLSLNAESFQAGLQLPVCESSPEIIEEEDDDMLMVTADMFGPNFSSTTTMTAKTVAPKVKTVHPPHVLRSPSPKREPEFEVVEEKCNITDNCMVLFDSKVRVNDIRQKYKKRQPLSSLTCKVCGKKFMKLSLKVRHENAHSEGGAFPCPRCLNIFKSEDDLKRHAVFHPKKKSGRQKREPFCCRICLKPFLSIVKKIQHDLNREKYGTKRCPKCNERFCDNFQMSNHRRIMHR